MIEHIDNGLVVTLIIANFQWQLDFTFFFTWYKKW